MQKFLRFLVDIYNKFVDIFRASCSVSIAEEAVELAARLFKQRRHRELVDFDNYLDDISLEWLHTGVDRS